MKIRISPKQAKEMLWLIERTDWMNLYQNPNPETNYILSLRKDSVLKMIAKFRNAAAEDEGK
jgi:hypothetical protein